MLVYFFWLVYVVYLFWNYDYIKYFQNHYTVGLTIVSVLIFLFFKGLLEDAEFVDITKIPIFYFSVGILVLFFSSLPFFIFSERLLINSESRLYTLLIVCSNVLLNLGYLGTALCMKKN
jgi:hypothetical protein